MIDASDFFMEDDPAEAPPVREVEEAVEFDKPAPDIDAGLPANLEAEKTILGAILLDNHAYVDVSEKLTAEDFSLDAHRRIFSRMVMLHAAKRAIDIVTLSEELSKRKEVSAVGGVAYLAGLTEGLPRRPAIEEYVRIVRDKSLLRKVMQISSGAIARAAGQSESAGAILEEVTGHLNRVWEETIVSPLETFGAFVEHEYQSVDDVFRHSARDLGIGSGISTLDEITCGWQRKELIIVAARPSMGKALTMDCMIKTVDGWKRNKDLAIGDFLASTDGRPSMVTGIFPQGVRQMFQVTLSDSRTVECDGDHLWSVYYRTWDEPRTLKTIEIKYMLQKKRYESRLWIETADGYFGHESELPLDPWALGALLGNACMTVAHESITFSSRDPQTIATLAGRLPQGCELKHSSKYDWRINANARLEAHLSSLGLMGKRAEGKHIPASYMTANRTARIALLQGLMDTDGNVEKTGSLVYSTSSHQLAKDVQELARSLGALATISTRFKPRYRYKGKNLEGQTSYRVYISHPHADEFVSLERKKERASKKRRASRLTFSSIIPTKRKKAQCISVSHPSSLYIATHGYIVTHNTAFALTVAGNAAMTLGKTIAFFSLEMSKQALLHRLVAQRGSLSLTDVREGRWSDTSRRYALQAMSEIVGSAFYIDDQKGMTVQKMHAKAARLKAQTGALDLVVIDQLNHIVPPAESQRYSQRRIDMGFITRALSGMATALDVPVMVLHQLSRENEKRDSKRPKLSDLRESGNVEEDADLVIFPHRESYYDGKKDNPADDRKALLIVAKQRQGPLGDAQCEFISEQGLFRDPDKGPRLW